MSSPVGAEVAGTVPYVKSCALTGYHSRCAASAVVSVNQSRVILIWYYSQGTRHTQSQV